MCGNGTGGEKIVLFNKLRRDLSGGNDFIQFGAERFV